MPTEFHRHRNFAYGGLTGHITAHLTPEYGGTPHATEGPVVVSGSGSQDTWSRDTLFPLMNRLDRRARARGKGPIHAKRAALDYGSTFLTEKRSYEDHGAINRVIHLPTVRYISSVLAYSGPLLGVKPGSIAYPTYSEKDLHNEMLLKGTTAIARTIPTNPAVEAGNLIGESVQQLPKLPGSALLGKAGNVSKKFADEYLNYEFGLKPTFSDVGSIVSSARNTNRILEQLERDSGRLVRRRYQFPVERTVTVLKDEVLNPQTSFPLLHTRQYSGSGYKSVRREVVKRMWFSGAYTYHYSQSQELWERLKRTEQEGNRLFGLRLSPSLAWELAPWSWAADWVTNAGDVITNISAFSRDGLVLKWGYVMCDLTITDIHFTRLNLAGYGSHQTEQRFQLRVKKRIRATPYGFGLDPDWKDFSVRQLAILGALGITRG